MNQHLETVNKTALQCRGVLNNTHKEETCRCSMSTVSGSHSFLIQKLVIVAAKWHIRNKRVKSLLKNVGSDAQKQPEDSVINTNSLNGMNLYNYSWE